MTALHLPPPGRRAVTFALAAFVAGAAAAQTPTPPTPASPTPVSLSDLAWVEGCWRGLVNKREFREQWMPLRGEVMLGVSQMTLGDKTVGYEYLRFEPRADGVYYVLLPSDGKEDVFRFSGRSTEKAGDVEYELFTFERAPADFPQRIVYRRGSEGWLYAEVSGKVDGADRKVIYPMHRVDCATGQSVDK